MTKKALPVQIVLKEGPVIIRLLNGVGVSAEYALWDGIVASEFFPPGVDSAFYVLSLKKPATRATKVGMVEAQLITALELLATAWPFSGGSFMVPESREVTRAPRYESNANQVEAGPLAHEGYRPVSKSVTTGFEALATYQRPPLATASVLAKSMRCDLHLRKLLQYHQQAWVEYYYRPRTERSSWFIHLYKIRDVLIKIYGKSGVQSGLHIPAGDWLYFERTLNSNDLRHAKVSGAAPSLARQEVDRLYQLARSWIQNHLVNQGLPVVII